MSPSKGSNRAGTFAKALAAIPDAETRSAFGYKSLSKNLAKVGGRDLLGYSLHLRSPAARVQGPCLPNFQG
jgi:hypothetical protein